MFKNRHARDQIRPEQYQSAHAPNQARLAYDKTRRARYQTRRARYRARLKRKKTPNRTNKFGLY